jgi:hypothetical protein
MYDEIICMFYLIVSSFFCIESVGRMYRALVDWKMEKGDDILKARM